MLLTRRSLLLLLFAAVPIALSALAQTLLYVALAYIALVGVMLGIDALISPRPRDFELTRRCDNRLSLGAMNRIEIDVRSLSRLRVPVWVRDEPPAIFTVDAVVLPATLAPRAQVTVSYHARPPRRGDYEFGDLNLRWQSALGLIVRQASYPARAGVKVYPNLLEVRKYELLVRRGQAQELGLRLNRRFGEGTEFERLREYLPDDEYRRIDWKATARRNKPITREFQTERSQTIMAVIDAGRMMRSPVGDMAILDYVVNAVLLFSFVAVRRGDKVGLLTFADDIGIYLAPRQGQGQFYKMLEALYGIQSQPVEANYARALSFLSVRNKRRSLVVLFTDLSGGMPSQQALSTHLTRLYPRHLPLCVTVSDPALTRTAALYPRDSVAVYERAVAEQMLDDRQRLIESLARRGAMVLDVPAEKLTAAVINKYLELKGRALI